MITQLNKMTTSIIQVEDVRKLRGGYYTPSIIADFVCKWAIDSSTKTILEPSCGDGNFVVSAIQRLLALGTPPTELYGKIKAVELIEAEANKAHNRASELGSNSDTILHSDFFSFAEEIAPNQKFDVVVGNPPFIRYQNFPEEHREKANRMMQKLGLNPNRLTNIWVPFLVISASLLSKSGKLGMVIPAELFQVKYAAEIRIFLANYFDRITIVTFKKLVFADIQQEVVLLLCEKKTAGNHGIRVLELENLSELKAFQTADFQNIPVKSLDHSTEKWTKYFLTQKEIDLLREIRTNERILPASNYLDVDVGFVTGRNDFFMLSGADVEKWGLQSFVKKVISRTPQLKGIGFTKQDFENQSLTTSKLFLFLPPDVDFEFLPEPCKKYVDFGEQNGFETGYKCRIRKRWYITPSLWTPQGFALRQVNEFPKLVINGADVSSTDTIHRVRFRESVNPERVAISFLNSLTFAFSETCGRSYGGGVLTFEPSEIEELPLPVLKSNSVDFSKIDSLLREKEIGKALDIVDQQLLIKEYGLDKETVNRLRMIWEKLRDRRIYRRR